MISVLTQTRSYSFFVGIRLKRREISVGQAMCVSLARMANLSGGSLQAESDVLRIGNKLLDSLPVHEAEVLKPYLGESPLTKASVLTKAGEETETVYFPVTGLVSCMGCTSAGEQLEIYAAGRRDAIGLTVTKSECWLDKVQIQGSAATVNRKELFGLLPRLESLGDILLKYLANLTVRVGQRACCAHFHRTPARISLWLAVAADITGRLELDCTQQSIADAVGTRRSTVTVTIGELERRNVLRCRRGKIDIIDPLRLQAESCECLAALRSDGKVSGSRPQPPLSV
jgi:CRP-like cAMP-binding protein